MNPLEIFADRIEIAGNTDIYLDPCRRLLECSDILVIAENTRHRISVWGQNLSASDYTSEGLHVHGVISSIEFE